MTSKSIDIIDKIEIKDNDFLLLRTLKLLKNSLRTFSNFSIKRFGIGSLHSIYANNLCSFDGIINKSIKQKIKSIENGKITLLYAALFGIIINAIKNSSISAIKSNIRSIIIPGSDLDIETLCFALSINGLAISPPLPGVRLPAATPAIIE